MTVPGEGVLDWLLRRHESSFRAIDSDLVLVADHPVFAKVGSSIRRGSETWLVAAATGELTLRKALLDVDHAVVIVPPGMRLPLDVSERAYLRRPLLVEAADVVAGVTQRFCQRIQDPALADAVFERADALASPELWPGGNAGMTAVDVRRAVLRVCLGVERDLERITPSELLSRWLIDGVPTPSGLVTDALRHTLGLEGAWLASAIEGGVASLVTAGALAGTLRAREGVPVEPLPNTERDWVTLRGLVEPAVRQVAQRAPDRLDELLETAEARASDAGLSPDELGLHPLLREPLDVALARHASSAASLDPVDEADVERLRTNIHAPFRIPHLNLLGSLTRLSRFVRDFAPLEDEATVESWAVAHGCEIAWADLVAREARRQASQVGGTLARHSRTLLDRYLETRDRANAVFAEALAKQEVHAFRSGELREALPLHLVTKKLVRPLLDAGERVLLLVLDGCDFSTLLELLLARELYGRRMGLALPQGVSGSFRSDLQACGALFTGLAPLPTVTSHARRALFAGELPGNPALDEPEAVSANATADLAAWKKNPALDGIDRRLLLKGDLGPQADGVIAALEGQETLLGVVFNGVDDALSSKETTAMGPWSFANAGSGLRRVVEVAIEKGWVVVVTADHGHTPFWQTDRKVAPKGAQRYAAKCLDGSVEFGGQLRAEPVHLLTSVGAYVGAQRRGFHGGASLEEVVVPIALLGRPEGGDGLPQPPAWWLGGAALEPESVPRPTSSVPPPSAPASSEPSWLKDVKEMFRPVLLQMHQHGVVKEAEVAQMTGSSRAARRLPRELDRLASVLPWRCEVETVGTVKRFLRKEPS